MTFEPWHTAKYEERVTRLSIISEETGRGWSGDDPVEFTDMLDKINPAAANAIRMELATWGQFRLN
jgi:hypothetical protein